MGKDKYMALGDFQQLWSEKIKPTLYNKTEIDAKTVQFAETADPASQDVIDEYQRVLAPLYQALTDAREVTAPAQQAASDAQQAAASANGASSAANKAAAAANSAAAAANSAATQVEDARGEYGSLDERLDAIEQHFGFIENNDPTSLLEAV